MRGTSEAAYNGLANVERAAVALQQHPERDRLFGELGRCIIENGLENTLGVCLSHRHTSLARDELIVQREVEYLGKPALISKKERATEALKDGLYPCIWIVGNDQGDKLQKVEFSAEFVGSAGVPEAILDQLASIIRSYDMQSLVGLSSIPRMANEARNVEEQLLESIQVEPEFAQIVTVESKSSIQKLKTVETNYQFTKNGEEVLTECSGVCWKKCVVYSPGHAIEHEAGHCDTGHYA